MGEFKFLNLFKPAKRIIPDVPPPEGRRVPFRCAPRGFHDNIDYDRWK